MHKETPSPVDLPDPLIDDGDGFQWASIVIGIAALILLMTNAVSLKDWVDDWEPSPIQARAADIAGGWLTLMRRVGVALPRDALHDQWKKAEAARFPDPSSDDGASR